MSARPALVYQAVPAPRKLAPLGCGLLGSSPQFHALTCRMHRVGTLLPLRLAWGWLTGLQGATASQGCSSPARPPCPPSPHQQLRADGCGPGRADRQQAGALPQVHPGALPEHRRGQQGAQHRDKVALSSAAGRPPPPCRACRPAFGLGPPGQGPMPAALPPPVCSLPALLALPPAPRPRSPALLPSRPARRAMRGSGRRRARSPDTHSHSCAFPPARRPCQLVEPLQCSALSSSRRGCSTSTPGSWQLASRR